MARVLVVDDDMCMRTLLAATLEREGHDVVLAPNGRDAVRLFNEAPAQVVITDMLMPEMNGLELIVALKKGHPDLPIIAMSGGSPKSEPYLDRARELGAVEGLEKPFSLEQLIGVLNRTLHLRTR